MTQLLDLTVLERFGQALAEAGAPVASALRPPLAPEALDAASSELGLELPDEVRTWWMWRDGALLADESWHLGWVAFLPVADAIEQTQMMSEISEETSSDGFRLWNESWIALIGADGASITADCNLESGEPSAIRFIDFEMGPESFDPVLPSLRALVDFWIEALERRFVVYNAESGTWDEGEPWPELSDDLCVLI